jgi:hypothetical protein
LLGSVSPQTDTTRARTKRPHQLRTSPTFGFDFAALDLDCIQSASLGFGLYFRWIGLDPFQKMKQGLDLDWFWPARTWIWIASAQPCLGFGLVLGFGSVFNLLNLNQVTYRPPGKLPGAGEQSIVGGIEKCRAHSSSHAHTFSSKSLLCNVNRNPKMSKARGNTHVRSTTKHETHTKDAQLPGTIDTPGKKPTPQAPFPPTHTSK